MLTPTSRLFGYARVSREKSTGKVRTSIPEGFVPPKTPREPSLKQQQAAMEKWAERHMQGRPVTFGFDEGISGAEVSYEDRPGFQNLVRQMKKGDHLAVRDLDRLERGWGRQVAVISWLFDARGIYVHTTDGKAYDPRNLQDRILISVSDLSAMVVNEKRKELITSGMKYTKETGRRYARWPGYGRRFEYVTEKSPNGRKPKVVTYIVWDECQCNIIREIASRVDDRHELWYEIALDLHNRYGGKSPPDGGKWLVHTPHIIKKGARGTPIKVRRVYLWYKTILHYGMDLGEDGVPAGVNSMAAEFGVDRKLAESLLPNNPKGSYKRLTLKEARSISATKPRPRFKIPDLSEWTE